MLKVYQHCLSSIFIIDTGADLMFTAHIEDFLYNRYQNNDKEKVTAATLNKYSKRSGYVVGLPLASVYNAASMSQFDRETVDRVYIGRFASYQEFADYIKTLYDHTAVVREKHHFVNFGSSLISAVIAIRQGKAEQEFNPYGRRYKEELALYRQLSKGGKVRQGTLKRKGE